MANGNLKLDNSPKNILGQLLASQIKELEKLGKQQVQEAVQQNVPIDFIAKQLQSKSEQIGVDNGQLGNQQQVSQALAGQPNQMTQPVQQQSIGGQQGLNHNQLQQPQITQQAFDPVPDVRQILGGLIRQTGASRQQDLTNTILEQQIRGEVPLQQGELQEIAIKQAMALDKAGSLDAPQLLNKFEPVANNFQSIFDSHQRVLASTENPSPAGDLALIFNFMKILDPQSVVREGEFATAQNSGAIPDRVRNLYNKLLSGERLTDIQRNDFKSRADKLFKRKEESFENDRKQFVKLAKKNNIDPDKVFRQIGSEAKSVSSAISKMSDEELQAIINGGQ